MRILVMSDCHGEINSAYTALFDHPEIRDVIFLGDGAREIDRLSEEFPERKFYIVRGNCDFSAPYPDSLTLEFAGKKILACHGHRYNVKYTNQNAVSAARLSKCDILLYGHTHEAVTNYSDGLYIMNPGSLSRSGEHSYGLIDITPSGILMNIAHL